MIRLRDLKLTAVLTFALAGRVVGNDLVLPDAKYATACGPISCCVALRLQGVHTSIDDLAHKCAWRKGQLTSAASMQSALESYATVSSVPVKLSPSRLCEIMQDSHCSPILLIRKNAQEINHASVAVACEHGKVTLFDYPELHRQLSVDQLAEIWDGSAILVYRNALGTAVSYAPWLLLPAVAVLVLWRVLSASRSAKKQVLVEKSR